MDAARAERRDAQLLDVPTGVSWGVGGRLQLVSAAGSISAPSIRGCSKQVRNLLHAPLQA